MGLTDLQIKAATLAFGLTGGTVDHTIAIATHLSFFALGSTFATVFTVTV